MQRCIVVIAFALVFSSCSHKSGSDLAIYKSIQMGLSQSSDAIEQSNKEIYSAIEQRANDFKTASYAEKWQPEVLRIKDISINMIKYIDSLLVALKVEAGLKMENEREAFREDDKDAVNRLFIIDNKGEELQGRLMQYKAAMLAVDTELSKIFKYVIIDVSDSFLKRGFTKTYFQDMPAIAAIAMLKKYKNSVVNSENQFLRFCLNKTHPVEIIDDFPMPLVSQSSSYVKEGDEIVITAGIGAYATALKTCITIGNKLIKDNGEGVVIYKFKARGNVGKNKIPIRLEFLDAATKRKVTVARNIEYSIIE